LLYIILQAVNILSVIGNRRGHTIYNMEGTLEI